MGGEVGWVELGREWRGVEGGSGGGEVVVYFFPLGPLLVIIIIMTATLPKHFV
jgi:hypothetical protein